MCAILEAFISTRRVSRSIVVILETKTTRKNDYKDMRIIDDQTYAELVKMLLTDPKVKLFQKLLLSQKAEPGDKPDEIKTSEVIENGI